MKKLKLEKIKLSEMPTEERGQIKGGTLTILTIILETINTYVKDIPTCVSHTCITQVPGWQDSCGLCTTSYRC